jgi:hypothetical protein
MPLSAMWIACAMLKPEGVEGPKFLIGGVMEHY